jgi:outer membrane protein OmpA-like peptidoglycan-associated protein
VVAATAPAPVVSVTGAITAIGQVAATAPAPTLAVAGDVAGVASGSVSATAPSPTLDVTGVIPAPITGAVSATASAPFVSISDSTDAAEIPVGVTIEVGALTLLNLVTLPGVDIPVGLGLDTGDAMPVVPLPGVSISVGASLNTRPVQPVVVDPRRGRTQWRYVVTDLADKPLGELVDIQHDPVEDGINTPTTMRFAMAADDPARPLIEAGEPMTRKCQVWCGNELLLWGPILPDQQTDNGTAGYTIHDPSWWWRGGRRVIGRFPRLNLLKNGDFKSGLTYWTRGYDADSKPKAAPTVRVVSEDFLEDTDGLDPVKAAEIVGVESVTESELSSNAVFWPNLSRFRPGGIAAISAVANAMPNTAGLKVTVIGHTANDGTGNGLALSLRRAQAAAGIIHAARPGAVITTKGVGFYDPKPGFPIDSQEQRRVVIQYDQTITGESKQWMRQTVEVTQPKTARYPLELTAAAMLKVADDWSVEDANMVSVKIVVRRKSAPSKPWDEQLGVGESSISDTDPVDRWIGQSASATVPADSRPYLVDVYLYAPAALARYTAVGLFPEEELYFWGVDQALIFKGIAEHIQDTALGHGDLGIETRMPLTGILRDRTYPYRDHMPADTALEEFAGLNRGMDYETRMLPDGRVILATHYPQQGQHKGYVLVLGGNVAKATPERSRDVASSIIMQAQDLGSYRAEAYAKDTRALGGLLLERVVTAEQETPLNELRESARQELSWGRESTTGYWLDIDPDSIDDVLTETGKGDVVRLILDQPVAVDRLARIVNRERHPDSLRLLVALDQEV